MLDLLNSFNLLKNLPIAKFKIIESKSDLSKLNFPYWMKASVPGHKTESRAVLKCSNLKEAELNYLKLRQNFHSNVIIQESVDGIEMILGLKEDKVFGKLLLIGAGGIFTESMKDVSFRALPVKKQEIGKMLQDLKLYPALSLRKKYALDKFVTLAERISQLQVRELDLNPVILNEDDAVIVDARASV